MTDQRDNNPYQAPTHSGTASTASKFGVGQVGLLLALAGLLGEMGLSHFAGRGAPTGIPALICAGISVLSIPGLFLSIMGLAKPSRRWAIWGVLVGLLGAMNVPTILISFSRTPIQRPSRTTTDRPATAFSVPLPTFAPPHLGRPADFPVNWPNGRHL